MAAQNFGRVNVSVTASTGGLTAGLSNATKQVARFRSSTSGAAGSFDSMNAAAQESGVLFSDIGGLLGTVALSFRNGALAAKFFAGTIKLLIVTMKALLIPLTLIASVMAVFRGFGNAASRLDEAGKAASRFGMSVSTFQAFSKVAEESGVSAEQAAGLFTLMGRQVGNLQAGSKSAQNAFGMLGLTFADLQALSPEQQFQLISDRIAALPTVAQQAAAASAVFGRQGAASLNFIKEAAGGATAEMKTLQAALGVSMTDSQVKGVEMMNDAWGRLGMVTEGFWNQFVAELAPAITVVSNLLVEFFSQNTEGWSLAKSLAQGFAGTLRNIVGAVTAIYGGFQLMTSAVLKFGSWGLDVIGKIGNATADLLDLLAQFVEGLPGADMGMAKTLRDAARGQRHESNRAAKEGAIWGKAASDTYKDGIENFTNPFGRFDAEMARVQAQMNAAASGGNGKPVATPAASISAAVKASSEALKAVLVGSSAGEEYRNSIMRGADPRLEGEKEQKRTADATERTADGVDELNESLAGFGGLGLATISV